MLAKKLTLTVHSATLTLRHIEGCRCHSKPRDWRGKEERADFVTLAAARKAVGTSIDPRCVCGSPVDAPTHFIFEQK
jgi:hypothetical protein